MPGTPHHALGSPLATAAVAVVVAVATIAVPLARPVTGRRSLAVYGGSYAVVILTLWAGVRLIFWRFAVGAVVVAVGLLVGVAVVFAVQAAVPVYLFTSYEAWTPLVWLFGVTACLVYTVLQVGGESGGFFLLLLWVFLVAPICFGALAVTTGGELLRQRLDVDVPV